MVVREEEGMEGEKERKKGMGEWGKTSRYWVIMFRTMIFRVDMGPSHNIIGGCYHAFTLFLGELRLWLRPNELENKDRDAGGRTSQIERTSPSRKIEYCGERYHASFFPRSPRFRVIAALDDGS